MCNAVRLERRTNSIITRSLPTTRPICLHHLPDPMREQPVLPYNQDPIPSPHPFPNSCRAMANMRPGIQPDRRMNLYGWTPIDVAVHRLRPPISPAYKFPLPQPHAAGPNPNIGPRLIAPMLLRPRRDGHAANFQSMEKGRSTSTIPLGPGPADRSQNPQFPLPHHLHHSGSGPPS